ncbi:MAG: endonuclease/exonuclease/phosphatase family protein [Bacteroidales bacterium]|nr:endonuclease/exonuclease/phosphatase family protein [Bacteroidales bacterium]
MRKTLFLVAFSFVSLLLAGSLSAQDAPSIKVMSYNIRYGTAKDGDNAWDKRCAATPAMLADKAPDVFGVQEALTSQLEYILKECPQYGCVGVGREDGVSKGEHMSVFYLKDRMELLKWGTYWLSETPEEPSKGWDAMCKRTATWLLLRDRASGREFFFVNTHLDHVGVEARRKGLALIVERIAAMNPNGVPMVLTGDFNSYVNDPWMSDIKVMMKNARFYAEDTDWKGSFNGWGKSAKAIDYIFYSGFSRCPDFKVVDGSYAGAPFISDHYPVIATLEF